MSLPVTLARVKPGDTIALVNILGRKLATVTKVSRKGFSVGQARFYFDGRGYNHAEAVAVLPDEVEVLQLIDRNLRA